MSEATVRPMASERLARWALVLGVAPLMWAIEPVPALWAWLLAYSLAWLFWNVVLGIGAGRTWLSLSRPQIFVVVLLASLPALTAGWRSWPALLKEERLGGIGAIVSDRLRLEQRPSIAPPVVFGDHPQTFFVYAPDASEVQVAFHGSETVAASDLGEGLFRLTYDPRRDGGIPPVNGPLPATIVVDGEPIERRLMAVTPLAHPRWFSSSPERGVAVTVSHETDELYVVGRRGLRHRVKVDDGPVDAALFDRGRRVAVSHRYTPDVLLLDARTGKPTGRVNVGRFQTRLAVSPNGSTLAVGIDGTQRGIQLVSLPPGAGAEAGLGAFVPTSFDPEWLAFGTDSSTLLVASRRTRSIHRIVAREGRWSVADGHLRLARAAVTMVRADAGRSVLVPVTDYRVDGRPHEGIHFVQDQVLTIDTRRLAVTGRVMTAHRTPRQDRTGGTDRGASPMGIAVFQDGSTLAAFAGTGEVRWLRRSGTGAGPTTIATSELPLAAPHGIADLGEGFLALSSPSSGTIVVFSPDGEPVKVERLAPGDEVLAARDPGALAIRLGEGSFYESTRSGLACQSCHLHADSDYSAHNLGRFGPTRSTRGLAGTAPYLTDASFPTISALNFVSQRNFRGYLRPLPGRHRLLQAYVHSLPLPLNPVALEKRAPDRERAGVAAFVKADCDRCHAFPAFTNLGQHPIRALWPEHGSKVHAERIVDTPSLFAVHRSQHFLHDGRARTLEQVLTDENRSNRHGNVKALSDGEREALVNFLETL